MEKCPRCTRTSYSLTTFQWCPWCDKAAPEPTPRRAVLVNGWEFGLPG